MNYWDSVSTLAGEVHNPEETIPKAFFLAVVLMVLAYTLPLAVGTGICVPVPGGGCAPASAWRDGYAPREGGGAASAPPERGA